MWDKRLSTSSSSRVEYFMPGCMEPTGNQRLDDQRASQDVGFEDTDNGLDMVQQQRAAMHLWGSCGDSNLMCVGPTAHTVTQVDNVMIESAPCPSSPGAGVVSKSSSTLYRHPSTSQRPPSLNVSPSQSNVQCPVTVPDGGDISRTDRLRTARERLATIHLRLDQFIQKVSHSLKLPFFCSVSPSCLS